MKVLLLEDDFALSDILTDHLIHKGFDVTTCSHGDEAFEALIDNLYDFAILDINTPTMSGLDILKSIREEYNNQTPIIIITAPTGIQRSQSLRSIFICFIKFVLTSQITVFRYIQAIFTCRIK